MSASQLNVLSPNIRVSINGKVLSGAALSDLQSVTVVESIENPSSFKLEFSNWDLADCRLTWSEDPLFECGNVIQIQMGYGKQLQTMIVGKITGSEVEFESESQPMFTVQGYDFRMLLMRSQATRSFTSTSVSDILRRIAQKMGMKSETGEADLSLDYILQNNLSDWEFIQSLATQLGSDVSIEDGKLSIQPKAAMETPQVTLSWGENLLEFSARINALTQVSKIEIRGYDVNTKQAIHSEVNAETQLASWGAKRVANQFGENVRSIVTRPVRSQEELDDTAKGEYETLNSDYITAEGTTQGNALLRAGTSIQINKVGRSFKGQYYVNSTTHRYRKGRGYYTEFKCKRGTIQPEI
ncbi:phage late control D family protein [Pseudanabaenaceae cyanobacterium LEGE 13415]|nr:phage late control D family protein [Pseudanabaenaceae cyanobacterium LEGE 13415]